MKRLIIILYSLCFVTIVATGQIRGTVKDASNDKPLELVNVVLLSQQDSSFIAGCTTDSLGQFFISSATAQGILRASSIGYKAKTVNLRDATNTILLERDDIMLGEIMVTAKKYTHTSEGLIVNIAGSTYSKLGYASDVLKHLPFVSQKNGDFTVFGKGSPIIYINNRQIMDKEELSQLSSSEIKQVKIITNPGAEYDATVNAVIKIITAKRGNSVGALLDAGVSQERRTSHFGGLALNMGKGDFDFFASLRYNRNMSFTKQATDITYNNRILYDKLEMRDKNLSLKGVLGFNMQHKDYLSAGVRYQYTKVPQNSDKVANDLSVYDGYALRNAIASQDNRNKKSDRHYVNGYVIYYFTKEISLKLDADYMNTEGDTKQDYSVGKETLGTKSKSNNNLYAGRLTFSTPLLGGRVRTGTELSYTVNKNSFNVLEGYTMQNELQTTQNTAKQMGQSYFVQYERDWAEHWSGLIGGRFEDIKFRYYVDGKKSDVSHTNRGFYPSASVSYNADDLRMTLAYRVTTRRPSYFMLRSAVEYNNPYFYEGGTPDLKSQDKRTLSLSLSWKDLQMTANYSHVKNGAFYVLDMYNGSDSIVLFHTKNISKMKVFNISMVYSPTWFKVWQPTFSIDMTKPYITYMAQDYNKPIFYFEFGNILNLPHNVILGCGMNYNTEGNYDADLAYYSSDFCLDAYCIKTVWKSRLRLKLSISNAINTSREKWSKSTNGIYLNKWNDGGKLTIMFTASYCINKIINKYKGEYSSDEIYRL